MSNSFTEKLQMVNRLIQRKISVYFYHPVCNNIHTDLVTEYELYNKIRKLEYTSIMHNYHSIFQKIHNNKIIPVYDTDDYDLMADKTVHCLIEDGLTIKGISTACKLSYDSLYDFVINKLLHIPIKYKSVSDNPF